MSNYDPLPQINHKKMDLEMLDRVLASCFNKNPAFQYHTPTCQYKTWTMAEIEDLLYMYDIGYSLVDICNEFHRTPRGVAAKLVRLGRIGERKEILAPEGRRYI